MPQNNAGVYDPGILETYIAARKDQLDRERQATLDQADVANKQADTEYRQNLAKQTTIQLESEHEKNQQALAVQQAQLDLAKEQLKHAHMQSVMEIQKGINEGSVPIPQHQFQLDINGQTIEESNPTVRGNFQKQPLNYAGITLQPNEYNTPAETGQQVQPLVDQQQTNEGKLAYLKSLNTAKGTEEVNSAPGGLYEQQKALEDLKTANAQKIADTAANRAETVAKINAAARETAARINGQSRIAAAGVKVKQIDPDALEERMTELNYGEGKPLGSTPIDLAAASALRSTGKAPVTPKTIENLKVLKPLESFSTDMTTFANTYLGEGALSGLANAIKLNAPVASDEKNAYNQLLLNSTNIAKAVEGATGRILMAQIQVAKDFISNKNITQGQVLDNTKKLNDALVTAVEGQLGNLKPKDRIDVLDHHGFQTIAAYAAKRWKVAEPGVTSPDIQPTSTKPNVPAGWIPLGATQ